MGPGEAMSRTTAPLLMLTIFRWPPATVATRAESGENAKPPYDRLSSSVVQSDTRQIRSPPPEASPVPTPSIWPFGENATPHGVRQPVLPENAAESDVITTPSATRHTLTELSLPADASIVPSGENESDWIRAVA